MRHAGKILLLFAAGIPASGLLASAFPWQSAAREISGSVRSANSNGPIPGATVILESSVGEVIQQMPIEGSGRFSFSGIAPAIYYVTARAPGYRERRERADVYSLVRVSVNITLQPETREPQPEPPAAKIDARLLRIPEPALKEYEKGNQLLVVKKDPAASIAAFKKALRLYPEFAEAHLLIGTAYMDMRKWAEAKRELEKAIEMDDKLPGAYLALGSCLNALGNYQEAEKPLLRGLELQPDAGPGHWELGRVYWTMQRWADAEAHARKAVELSPALAPAHLLMGNVLLQKRDGAGALQHFREYLRLEPQGPFAAATRDVVSKLEKTLGAGAPAKPNP